MTTAPIATSRPGVFADIDARFFRNLLAPLHRSWNARQTYRRTLADLRKLSIRQREDLGFAGLDLETLARKAVYTA